MTKLKTKFDVIEWYWPDFLKYCLRTKTYSKEFDNFTPIKPTIDEFWVWYISDGPMGVKNRNLYYTKEEVEYV